MRYLVWIFICMLMLGVGVAYAGDMDDSGVVRTPPSKDSSEKKTEKKAEKKVAKKVESKDEKVQPADQGSSEDQDPSHRMGAYFGLGEEFKEGDMGSWGETPDTITGRVLNSRTGGEPSRPRPEMEKAARATAKSEAGKLSFDRENHTLLRRGPDYDYFYQ